MPDPNIGMACPGCHNDAIESTTMGQLTPGPDVTNEAVCLSCGYRGVAAVFELTAACAQLLTVLGAAAPALWVESLDLPAASKWADAAGRAFHTGVAYLQPFNLGKKAECTCRGRLMIPGSHSAGCPLYIEKGIEV